MLTRRQGIYDIIIASDEKSEVFGDEAAGDEGEKKESKEPKKEGEESAEKPKKKRKHKKDQEYGVSRGT
jgi:ATP-dependent RNA helicase DDX56/DBP9